MITERRRKRTEGRYEEEKELNKKIKQETRGDKRKARLETFK